VKLIKQLFVVLALLCFSQANAAQFGTLNNPQPTHSGNKIEVLEFFFYGCSHCYHLHPLLSEWEKKMPKDVELEFVPTVFNPGWESMAYTYYALEGMGKQKQLHDALYKAWNVDNIDLSDKAAVTSFVGRYGVDSKTFGDTYQSFSVQSKVMRAQQMMVAYGIRGTPTLIVDGKYVVTGLQPEDMIKTLNEAISTARKARRSGAH
jgi:thiol:disulfide interchange protein DsbA